MIKKVNTFKMVGLEAVPVIVEAEVADKGVGIHLVGLADSAVKESLLRTVTALQAKGFTIPGRRIVINYAPADLRKSGSGYDLPTAVALLAASNQVILPFIEEFIVAGELGLDGSVRGVGGGIQAAELAASMGKKLILPYEDALEAASLMSDKAVIYAVRSLSDALTVIHELETAREFLAVNQKKFIKLPLRGHDGDPATWAQLAGNDFLRRNAEIAAAGGHHVLVVGAPGTPVTVFAKAVNALRPAMREEEILQQARILSAARKPLMPDYVLNRPLREPNGLCSLAAMLGGGAGEEIRPGEATLASGGVLLLHDFESFPKSMKEALRGPIEDRKIVICRLRGKVEYPATGQVIAKINPCPCGYYGEGDRCSCSTNTRLKYLDAVWNPLLDRFDIQVFAKKVPEETVIACSQKEDASDLYAQACIRVARAIRRQQERFADKGEDFRNCDMKATDLVRYCPLSQECMDLVENLIVRLNMSARAYSRIIILARTIADLEDSRDILPAHLAEAAALRFLDRLNPTD